MVTMPLVWLVSVLTTIAAFALAQDARLPFFARLYLCIFLLCLSAIGLLLGFRLSLGSTWVGQVQPLIAVMIAPSAYLGLAALAHGSISRWRKTLLVNGLPIVIAQLAILAKLPVSADVFVLGITSVYLFRTARLLRYDADEFVHVAPHAVRFLRIAIFGLIVLLGLMVATDVLIVAASLFAQDTFILSLLTGMSGVFTGFIFFAALVGTPMLLHLGRNKATKAEQASDSDREMLTVLDKLMNEKHIYTDSNMTLARVARRLSVPVRDVSTAINRMTDENFSRYINGYRIRHAQKALLETELPIAEVMFDAGFVSKSSFNTEFRRIVGQTPSQFRAEKASA